MRESLAVALIIATINIFVTLTFLRIFSSRAFNFDDKID